MSEIYTSNTDLKEIASELSVLLSSVAVSHEDVASLLDKLGYNIQTENQTLDDIAFETGEHVGIYKVTMVNGNKHYIRDPDLKELWSFYADVNTIFPKGKKKRIVLLGESVARGFLLDPEYTPAFVLELLLQSRFDLFDTEVIDLAETNLGIEHLKKRFLECQALEPDVIVLLAGNNWRSGLIDFISTNPQHYARISEAFNGPQGIGGIKKIVEDVFEELVSSFLEEVGYVAKTNKVSVIFAIPEFNLLDCQSTPGEQFVTKLTNAQIRKWITARDLAEESRLAGDFEIMESQARLMIDLDVSHPLGYELLAKIKIHQNLYDEARIYLEYARDTALYCRTDSKPRIFSVIRDTILSKAAIHNIHVVDLPSVFKKYLEGKIPGRDLFLDYCHFSVEGIQVASEAIAEKVLQVMSECPVSLGIKAKSIKASSETIAMGHLFASIHNTHWGQPYEIVYYHCLQAVKHSSETHKIMIYYIDMISRSASNTLCKSFQHLLTFKNIDKYVHALIHPKNLKSMEAHLVEAMVQALKYAGIEASAYAKNIRQIEHCVDNHKIDLLKSYYHSTSYDQYEGKTSFLGTKTAFFQARDTKSKFSLVAKKNNNIILNLTLRIPSHIFPASDEILLKVNDIIIAKFVINDIWQHYSVLIPSEYIIDDINRVEIYWALPSDEAISANNKISNTNKSLQGNTLLDSAFCVFGEIYSFNAMISTENTIPVNEEKFS